jgi:hypothetical protein
MELLATMAQLTLLPGFVAQFEAIDPATGAAVAGVVVTNAVVYGDQSAPAGTVDVSGAFPSPSVLLAQEPVTAA